MSNFTKNKKYLSEYTGKTSRKLEDRIKEHLKEK